jgi:hypothetical protein
VHAIPQPRQWDMTSYCPTCANLLLGNSEVHCSANCACSWFSTISSACAMSGAVDLVDLVEEGRQQLRYFCQTCPYIYNIDNRVSLQRRAHCLSVDGDLCSETLHAGWTPFLVSHCILRGRPADRKIAQDRSEDAGRCPER